jgi:predicted O-methyltransferase YrrM
MIPQPNNTVFSGDWGRWENSGKLQNLLTTHINLPKNSSWLELGSWEGRSTIVTSLILQPKITCIDIWDNKEAERRFDRNLKATEIHVCKIKSHWYPALHGLYGEVFDGAYIDTDHTAPSVLSQSVMIWPLIRPGGFILWDDYLLANEDKKLPVAIGVKSFLSSFEGKYKLLYKDWHVAIQKI